MNEQVEIKRLQKTNQDLKRLAEFDSLTGILNRRAAEQRIREAMGEGGAFFICDIDQFKGVNDRFGHLTGDKCLKQAARTLGGMIRGDDILGRFGGDEFIIFMPNCTDAALAQKIAKRIEQRFSGERKRQGAIALSITVGCAVKRQGDTYQTLFQRADAALLRKKTEAGGTCHKADSEDFGRKDIEQLRTELTGPEGISDDRCLDYETFQSICRFLERGIGRTGLKASVILLTAADGGRWSVPDMDAQMRRLGAVIQSTLEAGDVYTRCAFCQYMILAVDAAADRAEQIAGRVRERFLKENGDGRRLDCDCFALQSVQRQVAEHV